MKATKTDQNFSVVIPFINPTHQSHSNDFLSAICHELKTPLNAIIGFSSALEDELHYDQKSINECAIYAKEITIAANELNELVHDLLDVGQISSGDFSINLNNKINLNEIIARSIKLNYDYALRRKIQIKNDLAANIEPIRLDPKRLKQIFTNLISNSIKYSPENTEIKISAKEIAEKSDDSSVQKNQFLEISIIDQGFGMSEEQIKIAFEKYQTISNPNSGNVDSFGLGLPITKRLIEMQNGTFDVKSELGKGTQITIKFPYLLM